MRILPRRFGVGTRLHSRTGHGWGADAQGIAVRPCLCLAASTIAAMASGLVPAASLPASGLPADEIAFELGAAALSSGGAIGIVVDSDGDGALLLADDGPSSSAYLPHPRFGIAESEPLPLGARSAISSLILEAEVPPGGSTTLEVRGKVGERWTEWRQIDALENLEGADVIQLRLTLLSSLGGASPRVWRARGRVSPAGVRAAQAPTRGPPTVKLWATRMGLVGGTTANGHVVVERDHFVALPSKSALNRHEGADYTVQLSYRGRTVAAPVWDVGPWNTKDDYWNEVRERFSDLPRWMPQAEAAFFAGHNGGRDDSGRFVTVPAAIDLADGTFWDDLGMVSSDWVDVSFLWMDAPSPPPRPTPSVTAKLPPPGPQPVTPLPPRAASYNTPIPSSRVYLPLVLSDASGWTTSWTVQNPSPGAVNGTVALFDRGGAQAAQIGFSLAPFGSTTLSSRDVPGILAGFVGGAVVAASGPIAVVANVDRPGSDRLAYEGIAEGATSAAVPLVFKEYNGWSTGIQVQNTGSGPTIVQVAYVGASGRSWSEAATVAPMASHTFYQPANRALPGGFVGSAAVQSMSGQPIAVVATVAHAGGAAMAYPGITGGTDRLPVPIVLKRYNGWSTGLQLFNMGSAPAGVLIFYQGVPPVPGGYMGRGTVPGGGAITFYQPAEPQLPEGFAGWALAVAAPGSQLVGIVNQVKDGAQVAMNYLIGKPPSAFSAVPLVMKGFDGWETGIQVQNPGELAGGLALTFYDEVGLPLHRIEEIIDGGTSRTYYPPAMPEIPPGFRGSATAQAVPPGQSGFVVVVNEATR